MQEQALRNLVKEAVTERLSSYLGKVEVTDPNPVQGLFMITSTKQFLGHFLSDDESRKK